MIRMTPRERWILACTAAVIGVFSLDQALVSPLRRRWERQRLEIVHKERQMARDQNLLAHRAEIERMAQVWSRSDRSSEPFTATGLLKALEQTARQAGIKIVDLKPETRKTKGAGAAASLVIEAPWDLVSRFLYQVQALPQMIQIEKLSLYRRGEDTAAIQCQVTLRQANPNEQG